MIITSYFNILDYIIHHEEFQNSIFLHINEKNFITPEEKLIIKLIIDFRKNFKKFINLKNLIYLLEKNKEHKEVKNIFKTTFELINLLEEKSNIDNQIDINILIQETQFFIKKDNIEQLKKQIESVKDLNENNINDIQSQLLDISREKCNINFEKQDDIIDFLVDYDAFFDNLEKVSKNAFSLSNSELNNYVSTKGGFPEGSLTVMIAPPHTGKCVVGETIIRIKTVINDLEKEELISIEDFYQQYITFDNIKKENDEKFIDVKDISNMNIFVWSHIGWQEIEKIGKTIEYEVFNITLDNNQSLNCADKHIVKTLTGDKYVQDLKTYDSIITEKGFSPLIKVERLNKKEYMYDLQLKSIIRHYTFDQNKKMKIKKGFTNYIRNKKNIVKDKFKKLKDFKVGDEIIVGDSVCFITELKQKNKKIEISVDLSDHCYFTNGILSHNTLFLCNVAVDGILDNQNVLYISLEMSKEEILERIYSNLFDIKVNDITKNKKQIIQYLKNFPKNKGKLKIKAFHSDTCTNDMIIDSIESLIQEGFIPTVLIVDQITSMKSLLTINSMYERGKEIVIGLKSTSQKYKLKTFSAAQANREVKKNKSGTEMDNVAESWAIPQIADVVLGASTHKYVNNDYFEIRINGIKNRITGNLESIIIAANSNYMKFINRK